MPNVLIFRSELLAISETFILAQARALRRFTPLFAGLRRVYAGLPIPQDAIMAADGTGLADKCRLRIYKETGIAGAFHKRIRKAGVCLVHAHFAIDGVLALPIVRRLNVPLIVTLHGYDVTVSDSVWSKSRTGRLYLHRRQQMWDHADIFICVSDFIRNSARKAGFPEAKLRTHYIGVDRTEFSQATMPAQPGSVLFVGRLVEKKGCDLLIHAMHTIQRNMPRACLTIVGDGPMRKGLEALAIDLGIHCKFLGATSSAHVRQLLQQTAVVCAPSRTAEDGDSEGLPMIVLEAQSMGVPVVSTFHAGIPEAVLHGQTGLLATAGDASALAANLLLLLQNNNLRSEYAARGMTRIAEAFDLKTQTRRLEDIYDEASGQSQTPVPREETSATLPKPARTSQYIYE